MDLSPAGKLLLKKMDGDTGMVRATPAAMRRWGVDRPESIVNLLPESVQTLLFATPQELLDKDESELLVEACPTRVDKRIRIAFWDEYESASSQGRKMDLNSVVTLAGQASWEAYEFTLKMRPALLAWVMRPPATYKLLMREAEALGLDRLMEILELDIVDPKTKKVSPGVGLLVLQAIKLVDQRVRGAVTQKNVSLHMSANVGEVQVPNTKGMSIEEVEKRLAQLEQELPPLPGARVEVTESEATQETGDSAEALDIPEGMRKYLTPSQDSEIEDADIISPSAGTSGEG